MSTSRIARVDPAEIGSWSPCNPEVILQQIGRGNLLAISGGRAQGLYADDDCVGVLLPVGQGYTVAVLLAPSDTYTVRRQFSRGGTTWVKGEMRDVYCDQLHDTAYVASCYVNRDFGAHVVEG